LSHPRRLYLPEKLLLSDLEKLKRKERQKLLLLTLLKLAEGDGIEPLTLSGQAGFRDQLHTVAPHPP
jgi:hypothetical protein